ncbi:UbiA family prenyltransferase [Lentibacillus jeotgali]|uniref:UbiA family prenyltransferase n=1 Tax=Lentibacillus jeotgali TaxID=558169 RepID=UPI0002625C96|nr:UbiA family prenyltransferase [Lentibacillus jeotgali]
MGNNKGTLVVYLVIGLAIIGVVTQLFTNTASFLTSIFTMLGFGIAIFAVMYFVFFKKRTPSNDNKKYKKAVKQSKAKYSSQQNKPKTPSKRPQQPFSLKKKSNKRPSHLRVIDGNKSKRKNRASF